MPKDFKSAMTKMTRSEVVLRGERQGKEQPFGEALREELEQEAASVPITALSLSLLLDNPYQHLARPELDEEKLEELTESIRQNGFYGSLLARRKKGFLEQYELAYGHRRREAAQRAGLTSVPVKILELNDTQMARIMASENFSREDLTPMGEANIVVHLYQAQNLTVPDIARVTGKGEGWVKLRLSLARADENIRQMVEKQPETLGHIRLLSQIDDHELRTKLINEVLSGKLTRSRLESRIKSLKEKKQEKPSLKPQEEHDIVINGTSRILYPGSENHHNQMPGIESYPEYGEVVEAEISVQEVTDERLNFSYLLQQLSNVTSEIERVVSENFIEPTDADEFFLEDILQKLQRLISH